MKEFKYEELEEGTENFSSSHVIGKGSHGCVYKAMLKDGKLVAIKKPSLGLQKLGDNSKLENEVRVLSSLPENPYLVNLLGTSHGTAKNKVIVMEHMPNGTLHDLLHVASTPPPWPQRAQIAIQIARAVQFLHESRPLIIHRDIKTANVLFDSNWNARLADFGLAIMIDDESPSQRVDSVTHPAGTIGYLDPCYTTPGKLSTKNDVFSFGVVLLEIISCTKVMDVSRTPVSMVEWALQLIKDNQVCEICDTRMTLPRYMESTVRHLISIAARCVSFNEHHRPNIGEIVLEMENCLDKQLRSPIWIDILQNFIQMKKPWKRGTSLCNRATATTTATTTMLCSTPEAGGQHLDISKGKLLLREILADLTLN